MSRIETYMPLNHPFTARGSVYVDEDCKRHLHIKSEAEDVTGKYLSSQYPPHCRVQYLTYDGSTYYFY